MSQAPKKRALITGATDGIGKEIARGLLRRGLSVVLVGRNPAKGEAVVAELKQEHPEGQIELLNADLLRPQGARALARQVLERYERLDVLINNAGAYFAHRELTEDGFERTFSLNHLAYFALTLDLLPLLEKSAPARVVNLSSGAHLGGKLDLGDLHFERRPWLGGWPAYSQSKLANVLFTRELASRVSKQGIAVNAVHPGFVASKFGHNNPGLWNRALRLSQWVGRSCEKGAETAIYLATSEEVASVSGQYFFDLKPRSVAAAAKDQALARQLWERSLELVA